MTIEDIRGGIETRGSGNLTNLIGDGWVLDNCTKFHWDSEYLYFYLLRQFTLINGKPYALNISRSGENRSQCTDAGLENSWTKGQSGHNRERVSRHWCEIRSLTRHSCRNIESWNLRWIMIYEYECIILKPLIVPDLFRFLWFLTVTKVAKCVKRPQLLLCS